MYTDITNASMVVFDGITNQFLGEVGFELTHEAKIDILDFINYRRAITSLIVLNVSLLHPAEGYVVPAPYQTYRRNGIFRALFKDSSTGANVPIEMRGTYDIRTRSGIPETRNYVDSVELSNIIIESINEVIF